MMHTICVADGLHGIASFHEAGWFIIYQYRDREHARKMRVAVRELTDEKKNESVSKDKNQRICKYSKKMVDTICMLE